MTQRVLMTLSRLEGQHLADLVAQFAALVEDAQQTDASDPPRASDPAVDRLTPSPYPDDDEAAAEFRRATAGDILDRREHDALRVLADLAPAFDDGTSPTSSDPAVDTMTIDLDSETGWAWMRTLTAMRLVIATRLGIVDDERADDDTHEGDDRFGVYDWLGYRLDGLVNALSEDS